MPGAEADKVACRTPNADGVTNIPAWKFEAMRAAILAALAGGPLTLKALTDAVPDHLSDTDRAGMGSVGWHVATVKLELEMRGEIGRVPGATPQQIELRQESEA
ncbi:DUF6958 family protein [Oceanomicrobium pacificus]|uniref:Uncharacterized protein n=1 Tax=Oceanomicrobium pacificus TaxID=2692916 RepID=A0A6B0TKF4_9RHOB|nr:hypothetical protein [Oceanomicrobium pacificus]MXU64990.1 hypothetical protein [Oceanomicrobium pacificus]